MPEDLDGLSGSQLRTKLEEALSLNRSLAEQVRSMTIEKVTSQYDLVKPEDLAGVPAEELETKAKEFHERNRALQEELLTKALTEAGIDPASLKKDEGAQPKEPTATQRIGSVMAGGMVVPKTPPDVHGYDAIRAGIAAKKTA